MDKSELHLSPSADTKIPSAPETSSPLLRHEVGYYPPPPRESFPLTEYACPRGPFVPRSGPQYTTQVPWMPRPNVTSCPPGLEYLTQIDQLLIKQKKELFELITNIETENQYACFNTMGQMVYYCKEESDFCARLYCFANRSFTMHIHDNAGMEVIRVNRPYKYSCLCRCCSCADCCHDELEVEAPIGHVVGSVKMMTGCDVRYAIRDANRNTILKIQGPSYFHCSCYGEEVKFLVMSSDGSTEIGSITKQWTNALQEIFTDADHFSVTFPMDLDVRAKATLIGAVFLIDFMFFEQNRVSVHY